MSEPFSNRLRLFQSWEENQRLENELRKNSKIGATCVPLAQATKRIEELKKFESEAGYVFFGEKQWLISCSTNSVTYDDWVWRQLKEVVFPHAIKYQGFLSDAEFSDDEGAVHSIIFSEKTEKYWTGYTEQLNVFVSFSVLEPGSAKLEYLTLFVIGDDNHPYPKRLTDAFHILHNLPYFLHQAGAKYKVPVFLNEIILGTDRDQWLMNLITEDGDGPLPVEFRKNEVVR